MKKVTLVFLGILLILIFPALSWLQSTNFTGQWKLNAIKSDPGEIRAIGGFPSEVTLDIQHEGINLTIKSTKALRDRNWITEANTQPIKRNA